MTPEQISEWWESRFEDEWDRQLWEDGYVALVRQEDFAAERVALVAEQRWLNFESKCYVPSALWDGHVHHGYRWQDKKARAQVRAAMPRMLAQWRRKQARKARVS